jgi:hypothetical protein
MSTSQNRDSERYEIRVKGHLAPRWAAWFDGMSLTNETDGTTNIHGWVVDQAALHGLLQKLRDVGLPLVSVTQIERDQPGLCASLIADPHHRPVERNPELSRHRTATFPAPWPRQRLAPNWGERPTGTPTP